MTIWPKRRFDIERGELMGLHQRRLPAVGPTRGTLLYIHGLGESGLCFERLMVHPRLESWHQVVVDLKGYGKSPWSRQPLDLEQQADHLAELLPRIAAGPVVVLGHSMGGVIALLLAERHPGSIHALVDIEGNISLGDCGYSSRANPYSLESWLAEGWGRVIDQIYSNTGESAEVRRAYGASIQMGDPRAYHLNSQNLVAVSSTETLAGRLAAIAVPKVYFYGAPRGVCRRSLELLEEAEVPKVAIEEAGHWPFLDQTDRFAELLSEFLVTLSTSKGAGEAC